jgi:predicted MPP superfamily phosphohydrolase
MVLSWFWFAGACLGNIVLGVVSHNWWYAQPSPDYVGKAVRVLHALWMAVFPVLLWNVLGLNFLTPLTYESRSPDEVILALYSVLCVVIGLVVFPVHTIWRYRRRPPVAQVSNHTLTRDLAVELGYRPVNRSKQNLLGWLKSNLARLPRNEIFQVDFTEKTFCLPGLPSAWEGLTILHLSDLHLIGTPDRVFYDRVMDACAAWVPDLIALTGDIVDSDRHRRWIVPILARLRCNIAAFAILGNHDRHYDPPLIRRRLRRAGMRYLGNSWQQIEVRGEPLVVIGHEGPWFGPTPNLKGCPDDVFRLCLSHTPDNVRWARRNGIDLMLSGHNHGGQIRFPILGSIFVPSRYGGRYDCGTFHLPPTLLHVSRGLGEEHAVRYNCRPEVTKIILRRTDGSGLIV